MLVYAQHIFIDGFALISLVFTILFVFGMVEQKPLYFKTLSFAMLVYIGGFLVYRFKIQREGIITKLDRKVCYLGGFYILWFSLANIVTDYYNANLKQYLDDIVNVFKKN